MTIKEAAAQYGVSTQAIYQRLAKAGKKAKDITEPKTSDLTPDGEELLASWFATSAEPDSKAECKRCQLLEREIEGLQTLVAALQDRIQAERADKERLYILLNQAQQAQAVTIARLPAPADGLLTRLRKKFTRDG